MKLKNWESLRHLAVAILYFASSVALTSVSFHFWQLTAGLRLICLLLLPYRYWPAMAFGEMMSLGKKSYDCYDQFGLFFALANLTPRSLIAMPLVHWFRERKALFGVRRQVKMSALMLCAFSVSLLLAVFNFIPVWITMRWFVRVSESQQPASLDVLPRYFIGQYLGVLTIVPVALMTWQIVSGTSWRLWWTRLSASRLALETVGLMLPCLALLMWIAHAYIQKDLGAIARMAMFVPVAALAVRHGWRGAAISGFLASIALVLVMPAPKDPVTLQAEVFMSFAIASLLMLGARISALDENKEREQVGVRLAVQAAQQSVYLSELRMQRVAETIDDIGLTIQHSHERLLSNLRRFMPNFHESDLTKQALVTRQRVFRLADSIYPRSWLGQGLSFALTHGPIARAFEAEEVTFSAIVTGIDLSSLTSNLQIAFYRVACDAALLLYRQATLTAVHLRARVGAGNGGQWVALRIDAEYVPDTIERPNLAPSQSECDDFGERLGATAKDIGVIGNQAHIYRGIASVRSVNHGSRVMLLMHDTVAIGPAN